MDEGVPQSSASESPQMSEVSTLASIFFEPGAVFEDLRRRPRFLIAGLITVLLITAYSFGLSYKIGEAGMRSYIAAQIEKSPQTQSMDAAQKKGAVDMQMKISSYGQYAVPVIIVISFLIGALLYWASGKAFGSIAGFKDALAIWIYSGFPPVVLSMLLSFVVMAFKSADDIDIGASQRGLLHANLGFLVDGKEHPVIATLIATLDLFSIWGWILAAIGLKIIGKLSGGSAWAIVIFFALIGVGFRLLGAIFSGNPS